MRNIDIERIRQHGLNPEDFAPKKTEAERITELEERNNALESQNEMLTECILELSELLYN